MNSSRLTVVWRGEGIFEPKAGCESKRLVLGKLDAGGVVVNALDSKSITQAKVVSDKSKISVLLNSSGAVNLF